MEADCVLLDSYVEKCTCKHKCKLFVFYPIHALKMQVFVKTKCRQMRTFLFLAFSFASEVA